MDSGDAVTISAVAKAAGVGESTVSRVLRNQGSFSDLSRERVLSAAAALGYVPNRIAGSLASAGSRLVAVVVPSLSNIVFAEILKGAGEALDAAGFTGVFGVTDYDRDKEEKLVASLLGYRPAAVILAGVEHSTGVIRLLEKARCRVAELLDLDPPEPPGLGGLDIVVGFSNVAAGRSAARHLVDCGYRNIAYVGHDTAHDLRAGKRLLGFRTELANFGLALADIELGDDPSSAALGKRSLASLLARSPHIDAVYFSNDDMALGGYLHCVKHEIEVPRRLGIFGHNGIDIGAALPRRLSTILTPRAEVGRVAARLALEGAPAQRVDLPFELIAGETTARVRAS